MPVLAWPTMTRRGVNPISEAWKDAQDTGTRVNVFTSRTPGRTFSWPPPVAFVRGTQDDVVSIDRDGLHATGRTRTDAHRPRHVAVAIACQLPRALWRHVFIARPS